MKLRIQGDSIRLRLLKSEVDRLQKTGSLQETIHFPSPLVYAISATESDRLAITYQDHRIDVSVPKLLVVKWAQSDQIAIEGRQAGLEILIEKDFKCLDSDRPENADAFPNPREGAGCAP